MCAAMHAWNDWTQLIIKVTNINYSWTQDLNIVPLALFMLKYLSVDLLICIWIRQPFLAGGQVVTLCKFVTTFQIHTIGAFGHDETRHCCRTADSERKQTTHLCNIQLSEWTSIPNLGIPHYSYLLSSVFTSQVGQHQYHHVPHPFWMSEVW